MLEEDGDIEMQIESDDESDAEGGTSIKLSAMENRVGMPSLPYATKKDNTQVQDMDEASSDEDAHETIGRVSAAPIVPLLPPTHDKVIIKKYDPKQAQKPVAKAPAPDEFLISPITGEKIPASKMAEHMRIGLLDPRWIEQRDKHTVDKLNQDNVSIRTAHSQPLPTLQPDTEFSFFLFFFVGDIQVFAGGTAIESSLKQLAERRTDIFGVGDEETVIGKKLGEEETRKDERVSWDGHTSSVEAATRAARANITLEDQIHQIHKVKGLLHDEEKEKIGPKPVSGAGPSKMPMPPMPVVSSVPSMPQQAAAAAPPAQPSMPMPPPPMMVPMRPPIIPPFPSYQQPIPPVVPSKLQFCSCVCAVHVASLTYPVAIAPIV